MRLIDKDALLEQKVFRYNRDTEYHVNSGVTEAACEIIDAPTIDAIPVEWLCRIIRQEEICRNYKTAKYLTNLIWEWHQEADNETD